MPLKDGVTASCVSAASVRVQSSRALKTNNGLVGMIMRELATNERRDAAEAVKATAAWRPRAHFVEREWSSCRSVRWIENGSVPSDHEHRIKMAAYRGWKENW